MGYEAPCIDPPILNLKIIHDDDYREYSPLAKWRASVPEYVGRIINNNNVSVLG